MPQTCTAIVKHDHDVWIGWVEDVLGANCQEATRDALLRSLRTVPAEAIELNRADASGSA